MEAKLTYSESIELLRDQISTLLDQCDGYSTPTICQLLKIEGNKQLLTDSIVELIKKGYKTDQAISMLEREYNLNTPDD